MVKLVVDCECWAVKGPQSQCRWSKCGCKAAPGWADREVSLALLFCEKTKNICLKDEASRLSLKGMMWQQLVSLQFNLLYSHFYVHMNFIWFWKKESLLPAYQKNWFVCCLADWKLLWHFLRSCRFPLFNCIHHPDFCVGWHTPLLGLFITLLMQISPSFAYTNDCVIKLILEMWKKAE